MTDTVVLLTVDALRADHVNWLGYERNTTPCLNAVAAESTIYEKCIAQSSHTRESMPSMFYSAYPRELGAVGPVPDDRPTLVTELSAAGFTTAGFHSNPYLSRAYGFDRGFDEFDDSLPAARNRAVTFLHRVANHFRLQPYTQATELTDKGLTWLEETEGRRFLWLHYMDPHGPYQPPERYQEQFCDETIGKRRAKRLWRRTVDEPASIDETERRLLRGLYDAEIRYVDDEIGRFFDELASRNLLEETLIAVGADHGDLFGEHDLYGHPRRLFESLIHVPLLVHRPGDHNGGRVDVPVENIDIAPTLLDSADCDVPNEFSGTSLPHDPSGSDDTSPVFAHATGEGDDANTDWFAVRTREHKLHVQVGDDGTVRQRGLYDLSMDPDETNDLSERRPDLLERMMDHLTSHRDSLTEAETDSEYVLNDEVQNRLEQLGYR